VPCVAAGTLVPLALFVTPSSRPHPCQHLQFDFPPSRPPPFSPVALLTCGHHLAHQLTVVTTNSLNALGDTAAAAAAAMATGTFMRAFAGAALTRPAHAHHVHQATWCKHTYPHPLQPCVLSKCHPQCSDTPHPPHTHHRHDHHTHNPHSPPCCPSCPTCQAWSTAVPRNASCSSTGRGSRPTGVRKHKGCSHIHREGGVSVKVECAVHEMGFGGWNVCVSVWGVQVWCREWRCGGVEG